MIHWCRFIRWCALASCLLILSASPRLTMAATGEYHVSATPDWVVDVPMDAEYVVPTAQISNGVHYLLSDSQTRIDDEGAVHFRRVAMKALNDSGVDSVANLQFGFNPAFETLTLHSLRVHRDGEVQSRLEQSEVQMLQRERDLEARTYDGSKTANVFLSDVRVGDIVEYAYSVSGSNPAFAGREFGSFPLQWSVPLQRLHARLLLPKGREFDVRTRNAAPEAEVTTVGALREYRWQQTDLPPLPVDDDAPAWYDPWPRAHWSEFADWSAVANWSVPMYEVSPGMLLALQSEIAALRNEGPDDASRLLAALRMVQGEIRYLGIQIGAGSYIPSPPQLVLERRFGDCKDKTLLLLTLLRGVGIEARAALVNSSLKRGLDQLQPHPGVFNHVIVQASIDGASYWLDPTLATQSGTLANLHQPDYGQALVIESETRELVTMATERAAPIRNIAAQFDSSAGFEAPVTYTITTTYRGSDADDMRSQVRSASTDDLQHGYLNFYAGHFPGIESAGPIDIVDDPLANTLTVSERYSIPDFWPYSEEEARREAYISAPDIQGFLDAPSNQVRRSPLAVSHPVEIMQTTEVLLPQSWPSASEDIEIEDAHFHFSRSTRGEGSKLKFTDRFRSLAGHVEPEAVSGFAAKLSEARDNLGYSLFMNDTGSELPWSKRIHWKVALFALVVCGLSVWLALLIYRYDPPASPLPPNPRLAGLGGWLVLPGIGAVLTPIALLVLILASASAYSVPTWTSLTDPDGAGYHPMWEWVLLLELGGNLALLVASVPVLLLFFQRRTSLPHAYIGVLVGSLLIQVFQIWTAFVLPDMEVKDRTEAITAAVRVLISLLIWGSYFRVSERVRSTFTHRLRGGGLEQSVGIGQVGAVRLERSVESG